MHRQLFRFIPKRVCGGFYVLTEHECMWEEPDLNNWDSNLDISSQTQLPVEGGPWRKNTGVFSSYYFCLNFHHWPKSHAQIWNNWPKCWCHWEIFNVIGRFAKYYLINSQRLVPFIVHLNGSFTLSQQELEKWSNLQNDFIWTRFWYWQCNKSWGGCKKCWWIFSSRNVYCVWGLRPRKCQKR